MSAPVEPLVGSYWEGKDRLLRKVLAEHTVGARSWFVVLEVHPPTTWFELRLHSRRGVLDGLGDRVEAARSGAVELAISEVLAAAEQARVTKERLDARRADELLYAVHVLASTRLGLTPVAITKATAKYFYAGTYKLYRGTGRGVGSYRDYEITAEGLAELEQLAAGRPTVDFVQIRKAQQQP